MNFTLPKKSLGIKERQESSDPDLAWIHHQTANKDLQAIFDKFVKDVIEDAENFIIDIACQINDKRKWEILDAFSQGTSAPVSTSIHIPWKEAFHEKPFSPSAANPFFRAVWSTAVKYVVESIIGYEVTMRCIGQDNFNIQVNFGKRL